MAPFGGVRVHSLRVPDAIHSGEVSIPVSRRPGEESPDRRGTEQRALLQSVIERIPAELRRELEQAETAGPPSPDVFRRLMASLGAAIAHAFAVREDEVAILLVRDQGHMLGFAYPWAFFADKKNLFPVTAPSIAGQVLRSKRGRVDNNVSRIQHLDIYERVAAKGSASSTIQKMISAPMVAADGTPLGVIQISRKAKSPQEAGPNFAEQDLLKLTALGRWLAPLVQKVLPPDF
jgi:AcrR family transcriptional regulator